MKRRAKLNKNILGYLLLTVATLLMCNNLSAQHYIGIRGGYGAGNTRFQPSMESKMIWGLPSAGISYKYNGPTKYVGAIQLDLEYMKQGFEIREDRLSDTSYRRTINSIMMPFMWQPNVKLLKNHAEFFLNLGVYMCYNIDSEYKWISKREGVFEKGRYPMYRIRDNRLGYGLTGGAGLGVYFGRFEVITEARYNFGYSDILKNRTKYPGNPVRSPLDQLNISFGLFYKLNK